MVEGAVSAKEKKDPLASSTSYPNTANLPKDLCRANFVLFDLWLVGKKEVSPPVWRCQPDCCGRDNLFDLEETKIFMVQLPRASS